MALENGQRLGPYEILSHIGAGGMGEVYRAKDTRLDRIVAIKVLPAHLTKDENARQRLEREAKAVSALSHPNICALYDVGQQDGVDFLVMEFLEGETLATRLERGPLSREEILRHGIEIADALGRAHRAGLIHRDLKPGNIMLTATGAKLLDFGLAKAAAPTSGADAMTAAPTMTSPLTAEGTVVGTFQYMAPEQLEGGEADARSDIFAFGVVLYEMATARRAFDGKTQASLIASILKEEPRPVSAIAPATPPALDRLIQTCLEKDPDDRRQTMHDVLLELRWIADAGSQAGVPAPVASRRKSRERLAWGAAAAFALAAAVFAFAWLRSGPPEVRVTRAEISPPPDTIFNLETFRPGPVEVSPDGKKIAFTARRNDGQVLLWVRPLDQAVAQPLANTENAAYPFWSPDSKTLGFFTPDSLKKVSATGGPPLTLCDTPNAKGGTWSPDGTILFTPNHNTPIHRVSAVGGESRAISVFDTERGDNSHRFPVFLPDGKHYLYFVRAGRSGFTDSSVLMLGSTDDETKHVELMPVRSNVSYAAGHLLFVREGSLMAQPFDPRRHEIRGDAFPIADAVTFLPGASRGVFSVAGQDVLVYLSGTADLDRRLVWLDRDGNEIGTLGDVAEYEGVRISPDGKRAAVELRDPSTGTEDIWVYEIERGIRTRFTFHPGPDISPVWMPDSERIVFGSFRKGNLDLFRKSVGGSEDEEVWFEDERDKTPMNWSPDGRFLVQEIEGDLWVLPTEGEKEPVPFTQTEFIEFGAEFSPDAKWIAYVSNESGRFEVYVTPYPGPGRKWQVSTSGGDGPRWRRDGREILYQSGNSLMSVSVEAEGSSFRIGTPEELFSMEGYMGGDITGDAQRFLMMEGATHSGPSALTLVLNWTAGLE